MTRTIRLEDQGSSVPGRQVEKSSVELSMTADRASRRVCSTSRLCLLLNLPEVVATEEMLRTYSNHAGRQLSLLSHQIGAQFRGYCRCFDILFKLLFVFTVLCSGFQFFNLLIDPMRLAFMLPESFVVLLDAC